MKILLFIAAAVCGYAVAGMNPAIALSKAIYKQDIRECGSKNPGFTNFKRTFGGKWAWWVLVLDLSKAAVVVGLFAWLLSRQGVDFQLAAAYTGIFCMLGHAFPFQYRFKGGKGFLVCLSAMWALDWRVGLIATATMMVLLLVTEYMSLSTTVAMLTCPVFLWVFGGSIPSIILCAVSVIFMAVRHKENFVRLAKGKESKFQLYKGKNKKK